MNIGRVFITIVFSIAAALQVHAQVPVNTYGGSANVIAAFSGTSTIHPSSLWNVEIFPNGSVGQGSNDFGSMAFGPDNNDIARSLYNEAGPQLHFRLTRAYCDKSSATQQSAADQANYFCVSDAVTIDDTHPASSTPNKSFIIAPYNYGMSISYPGLIEFDATEFSVHVNTATKQGLGMGAHLWVGDNDDYGGLLTTANDVLVNGVFDRSQSFVSMTSETFAGASHGDMLFSLRDPEDSFRFQQGPAGQAEAPGIYKEYTVARIDSTGKGYFDGGTQIGGADFAESVSMSGPKEKYEPGDVLVIDTGTDRRVSLSNNPYSTLVAGIYSTKPGVIATTHRSDDPLLMDEVPMAVVGIVPCKVSTENGPIRRGDLLVTSSTPGYAMRGTDRGQLPGAIVGKALQPLEMGKGTVEVLITLR